MPKKTELDKLKSLEAQLVDFERAVLFFRSHGLNTIATKYELRAARMKRRIMDFKIVIGL